MKKTSTLLLQILIVLVGIVVLAFLLVEPQFEGHNANATFTQIYFMDPFLLFAYIASVPFFTALYQAFKLLGYTRQNELLSERSVKALRIIKYCAISTIGFILVGGIWILLGESDDRPPVPLIGTFFSIFCIIIATATHIFENMLQKMLGK